MRKHGVATSINPDAISETGTLKHGAGDFAALFKIRMAGSCRHPGQVDFNLHGVFAGLSERGKLGKFAGGPVPGLVLRPN
jgi:hypothetical protein